MTYLERKLAGLCTQNGCAQPAASDGNYCDPHREKRRGRAQRHMRKLRAQRRRERRCIYCGGPPAKSGERSCLACRIRRDRFQAASSGGVAPGVAPGSGSGKEARILARTRTHDDGRTRYHGQARRGQQPRAQLDDQDLESALTALSRAKHALALVNSPATDGMPRAQRDDARQAALAYADLSSRFVEDVLDRNKVRR